METSKLACAYSVNTLASIAQQVLDRDGNVNMIRATQEWREIFTFDLFKRQPSSDEWEAAFRYLGLREANDTQTVPWQKS
jgi:hypothetical protein